MNKLKSTLSNVLIVLKLSKKNKGCSKLQKWKQSKQIIIIRKSNFRELQTAKDRGVISSKVLESM